MHILHFLPVYAPAWQFGGPILSVSRLCEGLASQRVNVRVVTTNAGLPDFPSEQFGIPQNVNGVQVIYYPVDHAVGPIRSRSLVEALPDHMHWADLLHLSSIWQPLGIPVQTAAHSAGVPVIQTLRGALGPYSWRRGWWKKIPYFLLHERNLLQRAVALHCTTRQEASEIRWLGLKPPIKLLSNPIDTSHFYYSPNLGEAWRRRMGIPLEVPLLLVVGRLHHKKGLDILPKALKRINNRNWQIVFIGNDEDGTGRMLKSRMRQYGLANRCHWLDSLPTHELVNPYNASDCLLMPSRHENFGNVAVEALACGCRVLLSDKVGVSQALPESTCIIISPRNTNSWANHISSFLDKPRPGIESVKSVQGVFSHQTIAKEALEIYQSILNLTLV